MSNRIPDSENTLLEQRLIRLVDSCDRACAVAAATGADILGYELLREEAIDCVRSLGLEPIGEHGDAFDPRLHEAVSTAKTTKAGLDGTVEDVKRRGWRRRYFSGDETTTHAYELVRAAQVVVCRRSAL